MRMSHPTACPELVESAVFVGGDFQIGHLNFKGSRLGILPLQNFGNLLPAPLAFSMITVHERSMANSGSAAARALTPHNVSGTALAQTNSPQRACGEISRIFRVGLTEVALMRIEGDIIHFLFPAELQADGFVPLSSSKAVAARTAITRKVELFNNLRHCPACKRI